MGKYQSPKLKDVSSNLTAPAKLLECLFGFHDLKWVYINTHEIMGFTEVYHCSQVCKRCNKTIFVGPVAHVKMDDAILKCKEFDEHSTS